MTFRSLQHLEMKRIEMKIQFTYQFNTMYVPKITGMSLANNNVSFNSIVYNYSRSAYFWLSEVANNISVITYFWISL